MHPTCSTIGVSPPLFASSPIDTTVSKPSYLADFVPLPPVNAGHHVPSPYHQLFVSTEPSSAPRSGSRSESESTDRVSLEGTLGAGAVYDGQCHTQVYQITSTTSLLMQEIQNLPTVTSLQIIQGDPTLEDDKKSIYDHPLYPLLSLLLEKCESATAQPDSPPPDTFEADMRAFIQRQEGDNKPFFTDDSELDSVMVKAIQVLRIHLVELRKVNELCKDFCTRYISCLKTKIQSDVILQDSAPSSPTGSEPMSPPYGLMGSNGYGYGHSYHMGMSGCYGNGLDSGSSPPPGFLSGDSGSHQRSSSGHSLHLLDPSKQKRGVLPKRATQVMKQWLFQHLVHPYPTEDEKRQIANQTNLTLLQVNNWFINARRRILHPMLDASNSLVSTNSGEGGEATSVTNKKKKAATNRPTNNRFWPASLVNTATTPVSSSPSPVGSSGGQGGSLETGGIKSENHQRSTSSPGAKRSRSVNNNGSDQSGSHSQSASGGSSPNSLHLRHPPALSPVPPLSMASSTAPLSALDVVTTLAESTTQGGVHPPYLDPLQFFNLHHHHSTHPISKASHYPSVPPTPSSTTSQSTHSLTTPTTSSPHYPQLPAVYAAAAASSYHHYPSPYNTPGYPSPAYPHHQVFPHPPLAYPPTQSHQHHHLGASESTPSSVYPSAAAQHLMAQHPHSHHNHHHQYSQLLSANRQF